MVAPLEDLIHPFSFALKDSLYGAIPAVLDPTHDAQFKSHLLSVVSEENPLDSSFNDDARPRLFHPDLTIIMGFA